VGKQLSFPSPRLLATCLPGKEEKAELELLDALLLGGARDIRVRRTCYPGVLLVEAPLPPEQAYEAVRAMQMAYVRSVTPLQAVVRAELQAVVEASVDLALKSGLGPGLRFAVRCRRRGKALSSSTEVERAVGKALVEATGADVDLEEPDLIVRIEVIDDLAGICILRADDGRVFKGIGRTLSPISPSPELPAPRVEGIKGAE